uniref:Uncharacterized protein n=1 Tax=Anguilla anguilla TaxID=7936 RepID=A0A0E9RFS7_ANGAN
MTIFGQTSHLQASQHCSFHYTGFAPFLIVYTLCLFSKQHTTF